MCERVPVLSDAECSWLLCLYLPGPIYRVVCKHVIILHSILPRLELGVYTSLCPATTICFMLQTIYLEFKE